MEIRDWLLTISMLAHFGQTLYAYIERRGDKTNERIGELASKVDQLDKDVTALKSAASTAPTHNDIGKVYESINGLSETVHQLVGESRGQSETLRIILNRIAQKGMQ